MKISVGGQVIFELSETHKKLMLDSVTEENFGEDLIRRLRWGWVQKIEPCFKRVTEKWLPILKQRYESLPSDDDKLLELIFSQPDYKTRTQRDNEELVVKYQKIVAEHGQESADNYVNSAFNAERLATIKAMIDSKED